MKKILKMGAKHSHKAKNECPCCGNNFIVGSYRFERYGFLLLNTKMVFTSICTECGCEWEEEKKI